MYMYTGICTYVSIYVHTYVRLHSITPNEQFNLFLVQAAAVVTVRLIIYKYICMCMYIYMYI